MDDTAEAISYQEEISKLLSTNLTADDDLAAEKELERIELEEIAKLKLPSVPEGSTAPERPIKVEEQQPEEVAGTDDREAEAMA